MPASLTPQELLAAYTQGYFPMAMQRSDTQLYWFCPEMRGVMPLDNRFHIPRSLGKLWRAQPFRIAINQDFPTVIRACATARDESWINQPIIDLYTELHHMGYAHSVECWNDNNVLVGGLYGIALGGAFFGESMFSHASGASKIALIALVEHLRRGGFTLLDTQYVNDHLKQFGIVEIPRAEYLEMLEKALAKRSVRFLHY